MSTDKNCLANGLEQLHSALDITIHNVDTCCIVFSLVVIPCSISRVMVRIMVEPIFYLVTLNSDHRASEPMSGNGNTNFAPSLRSKRYSTDSQANHVFLQKRMCHTAEKIVHTCQNRRS